MAQKVFLDWQWVNTQLSEIHKQIDKPILYVTGIPRGGLIPAVMFSHRFSIKFIELEEAKNLTTTHRKSVLVFDDIADTGVTLTNLQGYEFPTATLTTRQGSSITPTFTGELITTDDWLVFPWEREDSQAIQDYLT